MAESKSESDRARAVAEAPGGGAALWSRRLLTTALIAYWLLMFTATHIPKVPQELDPGISDKWQHYVAYSVLGVLLAAWWSLRHPLRWRTILGLLAIASLYGALDESTQPLFGRDAELLDWRADLIGAATGVALFTIAARVLSWFRAAN